MQANLETRRFGAFPTCAFGADPSGVSAKTPVLAAKCHASMGGQGHFPRLLKADAEVVIDDATLESLFDLSYHVKHVDTIFKRVSGEG